MLAGWALAELMAVVGECGTPDTVKPKYPDRETCPSATLYTTNPTCNFVALNSSLRGESPAPWAMERPVAPPPPQLGYGDECFFQDLKL
jgi:hypothetical protein